MNRTATIAALALAAWTGGAGRAQNPQPYYGGQFPTQYGGQYPTQLPGQVPGVNTGQGYPTVPGSAGIPMTQPFRPPLSPYLNLLRGGDPAINYFYAVQPAVSAGASPLGSMGGGPSLGYNQLRSGYLPAAANPTQEPVPVPAAGVAVPSLPPSGHPVSYGGITRYSPGGGRPSFLGNQPPPPAKRRR
jgi:hypothetical protein